MAELGFFDRISIVVREGDRRRTPIVEQRSASALLGRFGRPNGPAEERERREQNAADLPMQGPPPAERVGIAALRFG
jgi:hypothetical protein